MPREELMRHALALARLYDPAPNPRVGALVVKNGRIIGEGSHRKAGEPHAEVLALTDAAEEVFGSDLWVSLEPCCHRGGAKRTPPCTDLIIKSGIKRVFIASADPNPEVSGKGIAVLKDAGIDVECGILDDEERQLNREYHHFRRTGRPWIHLKQAVSLDGFISAKTDRRTVLSCGKALNRVHRLRASHQAVLCGGSTVIADNPGLTVRRGGGSSPVRLILEGREDIPEDAKIFDTSDAKTILYTCSSDSRRLVQLEQSGVEIVRYEGRGIDALLADTADRGIISILAEAGGKLAASLLEAELADEISLIYAPVLLGGGVPMAGGSAVSLKGGGWTESQPEAAGSDVVMNWRKAEAGGCSPV